MKLKHQGNSEYQEQYLNREEVLKLLVFVLNHVVNQSLIHFCLSQVRHRQVLHYIELDPDYDIDAGHGQDCVCDMQYGRKQVESIQFVRKDKGY